MHGFNPTRTAKGRTKYIPIAILLRSDFKRSPATKIESIKRKRPTRHSRPTHPGASPSEALAVSGGVRVVSWLYSMVGAVVKGGERGTRRLHTHAHTTKVQTVSSTCTCTCACTCHMSMCNLCMCMFKNVALYEASGSYACSETQHTTLIHTHGFGICPPQYSPCTLRTYSRAQRLASSGVCGRKCV